MLNIILPFGEARSPRGVVKLNGTPIDGWVDFEVDSNGFYQADTFRVNFAANWLPIGRDKAWLLSQADLTVELFAGFPIDPQNYDSSALDSLIIGRVDDVQYKPVRGLIELSGRDYTSQFIDAKTAEQFTTKTASQVAQILAQRHGLTAVVQATTTPIGAYYQIDHVSVSDSRTEWDLLTWLAHKENFACYVKGQTLHFEPLPDPDKSDTYVIHWTEPTPDIGAPNSNVIDIDFSRNLTVAKDIIVYVRSMNAKQKKGFTVKAQAQHNKNKVIRNAQLPYGQAQVYSFSIPGLSQAEAQARANAFLQDLSKHEMRLHANLPGDGILSPRTLVTVTGTETVFDQVYYPESVIRTMSIREGYCMSLAAKNHSVESVPLP
jgi:phage protein D